jgi:hypothetical protein
VTCGNSDRCDLEFLADVRLCAAQWPSSAALCAEYVPKITTAACVDLDGVPGLVVIKACMSVLTQRFTDPSLGELVLAHDALGVDPQQHVDAVPGPLGHLGRIHAAVEPRG